MKTSEMIAMLEKNPKLRFQTISCLGNKVIAEMREDDKCPFGVTVLRFPDERISLTSTLLKYDWTLVREPVPAWEAVKALKEGKKVYCDLKGARNNYVPENYGYIYMDDILNATWYIND